MYSLQPRNVCKIKHSGYSNIFTGSLPSPDRLTTKNVYDLDSELTGVEITISGAAVSDSGTYECRATNKYGSVTKEVTIDVRAGSPPGEVVSG